MKKAEMDDQFNNEAKKGWRYAADAPRFTDENAGILKTASTRQEEFLLLSTVTWEEFSPSPHAIPLRAPRRSM